MLEKLRLIVSVYLVEKSSGIPTSNEVEFSYEIPSVIDQEQVDSVEVDLWKSNYPGEFNELQ